MSSKQVFASVLAALICALVVVRAAPQQAASDGYAVGPKDVLSIVCFNDASVSGKFTVQPDGLIDMIMIGSVKVSGLTAREIEGLLKDKYKKGNFIGDPKITVTVDVHNSQKVIIQGEVARQGEYQLTGGMTLLQLVALAGSTLATASGEAIIVRMTTNPDKPEMISVDLSQLQNGVSKAMVPLKNGDVIIVPPADRAYIIGEVRTPGAYAVRRNTTLVQLLSLAGGLTPDAAKTRITIIRTVDGKRIEISKAKETEIVKPGDTINVPVRRF